VRRYCRDHPHHYGSYVAVAEADEIEFIDRISSGLRGCLRRCAGEFLRWQCAEFASGKRMGSRQHRTQQCIL